MRASDVPFAKVLSSEDFVMKQGPKEEVNLRDTEALPYLLPHSFRVY